MKNTVLRYGLYGAITICILFLLSWFLGDNLDFSTQEIIGYASMIVALSFVYFGIKHFRDIENKGVLTFKKGITIGILISLITALAFGGLDIIYVEYINPDFMEEYYTTAIQQLKITAPAEELQDKLTALKAERELFSSPIMSFIIMAITVFAIGFIFSLISAALLKHK